MDMVAACEGQATRTSGTDLSPQAIFRFSSERARLTWFARSSARKCCGSWLGEAALPIGDLCWPGAQVIRCNVASLSLIAYREGRGA